MALHDFFCQVCGQVLVDVNVPIAIGATAGAPFHCGKQTAWIPQVGRMDAYEPFQEFETRDGQNNLVTVDSLKKLRDIERDSEQRYRDGEGQPLVWRRYSQDTSNWDVHSLHPKWDGGERPTPEAAKRFGQTLRRSTEEPEAEYGPGVSDSSPAALDTLPWTGK